MRRRRGEEGLFRGCCLGLVILLALFGLLGFLVDRALAAPALGPPPSGRDDGSTQQAIALNLGIQLAGELITQPQAVVTVSEHDLTVLAAAHNPHPDRFHNLQVRSRDGLLLVSADTGFGPLTATVVAHLQLALQSSGTGHQVVAHVVGLDFGDLHIPGWLQSRLVGSYSPTISFDQLFKSLAAVRPVLGALQANIECVSVAPDGVHIGVHRPGATPEPDVCGA